MKRALTYFLLALAALAPFVGLGRRDLWAPDEADHATAARELLAGGRWAVPTIAGEPFTEKPPLQAWIIVLSAKARGTDVDPFDARVPSALGNVVLVLATFAIGARVRGAGTGVLAALAVAATGEAAMRARWCQVDMLFAGFFAFATYGLLRLATKPRWTTAVGTGVALGLSVLTKGPLAIVLSAAIVIGDAALEREHRVMWRKVAVKHLLVAWLMAAGIAAPWYLALSGQDSSGISRNLFHENVQRFLGSQDHSRPPWYYVEGFFAGFAPSSLIAAVAFFFCARTTGVYTRNPLFMRDASALRFALGGFAAGLVLLSIASSKQAKYLLPLAPLWGVILADFAEHAREHGTPAEKRWASAILSVIAFPVVVATMLLISASFFGVRTDEMLGRWFGLEHFAIAPLLPSFGIAAFGCLALLAVGIHSPLSLRLGWLLAPLILAEMFAALWILPMFEESKSPRPVVERAMTALHELDASGASPRYAVWFVDRSPDRPVESWTGSSPYVYYAEPRWRLPIVLHGAAELRAALDKPGPIVMVLRETYFQNTMPADLRARFKVRFQDAVGSRNLVVLQSE